MIAIPMSARVRCKSRGCDGRVSLTADHVRELGAALKLRLTCPKCGSAFVHSLIPEVRAREDAPSVPAPRAVPPRPTGVEAAAAPFRPLAATADRRTPDGPPAPLPHLPPTAAVQAAFDPLPFSPLDTRQPSTGQAAGFGWWGRLPKRRQNLFLAVGLVLAAGFAVAVKFRGTAPQQVQPQAEQRQPPPPAAALNAVPPGESDPDETPIPPDRR